MKPALIQALAFFFFSTGLARADSCGEVITVPTHGDSNTRYTLTLPAAQFSSPAITLVLLPGGSGHADLDEKGCARQLKGNSLIKSIPLFRQEGLATALVDAPSDHHGADGLEGFRARPEHAADLGKIIHDIRKRTKGAVWLAGTSRGSISAANAAARLAGAEAADGVILTSALMVGSASKRRPWLVQTVFELPLESIRVPVLLIGHAQDNCLRSPPERMPKIMERLGEIRKQMVTVSVGAGNPAAPSLAACEGRAPHGFADQEAELASGIARFVKGGNY